MESANHTDEVKQHMQSAMQALDQVQTSDIENLSKEQKCPHVSAVRTFAFCRQIITCKPEESKQGLWGRNTKMMEKPDEFIK